MANIFIATPYKLNAGQLLGMQIEGRAIVVQIVREVTKEEHHAANPGHTEQDYAELPTDTKFYETADFTGEVVLAMPQEKKPDDIVRNSQLGTWRILRSATPEEYLQSLIDHGEAGPGSPVLDPIMTLLKADQGDTHLYWATPYTAVTVPIHLTRDELLFLARLVHDWTFDQKEPNIDKPTFVIAKISEAIAKIMGEETIQKLQQGDPGPLTQETVCVGRVH